MDAMCHKMCGTLKNPHCSMDMSSEHRSKFSYFSGNVDVSIWVKTSRVGRKTSSQQTSFTLLIHLLIYCLVFHALVLVVTEFPKYLFKSKIPYQFYISFTSFNLTTFSPVWFFLNISPDITVLTNVIKHILDVTALISHSGCPLLFMIILNLGKDHDKLYRCHQFFWNTNNKNTLYILNIRFNIA